MVLTHPPLRRLSAALLALVVAAYAVAEAPIKTVPLVDPNETDAKIARGVVSMLEGVHLTRHKVDKDMSQRLHQLFLESWDPGKRFFLQSDIDEFAKFQNDHGEAIRDGKFDHAYTMFKRYRERLEERVKWASELADAKHDFAKQETIN